MIVTVVGLFLLQNMSLGNSRGMQILPDKSGLFKYVEDFKTPRFLADCFTDNLGGVNQLFLSRNGPEFFHAAEAFEVTENGLAAFPCKRSKGTAILQLDSIESGRVFVLRSKSAR